MGLKEVTSFARRGPHSFLQEDPLPTLLLARHTLDAVPSKTLELSASKTKLSLGNGRTHHAPAHDVLSMCLQIPSGF